MGIRKKFDYRFLIDFKYLQNYELCNLNIPKEQTDNYARLFVYNENSMPVLLKFWDISFVADSDKINSILVELRKDFLNEVVDFRDEEKINETKIAEWLNFRLNGLAKISNFKDKGVSIFLTNQISPYAFSEDGIEIERIGGKQKSKPIQKGE